jgi:hypothetical protein
MLPCNGLQFVAYIPLYGISCRVFVLRWAKLWCCIAESAALLCFSLLYMQHKSKSSCIM